MNNEKDEILAINFKEVRRKIEELETRVNKLELEIKQKQDKPIYGQGW